MRRPLRQAWTGLLDLVLPGQCPLTGDLVLQPGDVSPRAWARLHFIAPPLCDQCGVPFDHVYGEGVICGACAALEPVFDKARSALVYDQTSRKLVLAFKHGDRMDGAPGFARWMARAGADLLQGADILAPVPLHSMRLLHRRYNQSAILAAGLARQTSLFHCPDLLRRRRRTPSQAGLSADQRKRNVAGAFEVRQSRAGLLKGAIVVLVDDVFTTGATLSECAKVLKRGGAKEVRALTLARVVREGAGAI